MLSDQVIKQQKKFFADAILETKLSITNQKQNLSAVVKIS